MKKISYLFVFMVFVLFFSCENNDYAARVGNYVIKIQDVSSIIDSRKGVRQVELDMVMGQVESLVDQKLMLIGALRGGLENDSTVNAELSKAQDKEVYTYLIQKDIIDKVVTTKLMRQKYDQRSREWRLRHIFRPLKEKKTPEKEIIISELNAIKSRLLRGEDFDALARAESKDSLSAGKGGDLGFLKWDDAKYGPTFFPAIEKLSRGQISKVLESDAGFHVVKVEAIRTVDQVPFSKAREQLQRSFFRQKNAELDSTYFAYIDRLKERFDVQYNQENLDSIYQTIVAVSYTHLTLPTKVSG
mgnify:CR=1 FL=1